MHTNTNGDALQTRFHQKLHPLVDRPVRTPLMIAKALALILASPLSHDVERIHRTGSTGDAGVAVLGTSRKIPFYGHTVPLTPGRRRTTTPRAVMTSEPI